MPTQKQQAFFDQHSESMISLIERTNVIRATKNQPPLVEKEIDAAVDDFILLNAKDEDIDQFKFPEPPPGTPPLRSKAPETIQGERLNFEIIKAGNGFIMTGAGSSFIFKSREELAEIFDEILFTKWLVEKDLMLNPALVPSGVAIIEPKRGRPKKVVANGK